MAVLLPAGLALVAPPATAQAPSWVQNAEASFASAAGGLAPALQEALRSESEPGWIGYEVPMVAGRHGVCCYRHDAESCCGFCNLEDHRGTSFSSSRTPSPVELEAPRRLRVLMRREAGRIDQLRVFSADCTLDAGGLSLR